MGEQSSWGSILESPLSSIQDVGWIRCHLRACLGLGGPASTVRDSLLWLLAGGLGSSPRGPLQRIA